MKIIFRGTVQGVGFRPSVYKVAKALDIRGYVLNRGSSVEVGICDDVRLDHTSFLRMLRDSLPEIARIESVEILEDSVSGYDDFVIVESGDGERTSFVPADTAICEECVKELLDEDNRRYLYPFICCTACGARFSLIEDVPYDRERTAMRKFEMCEECRSEYEDPKNRRFHAETISCWKCGPRYTLFSADAKQWQVIDSTDPIRTFARLIDEGATGILKGWGGMHIVCSTDHRERVLEIRNSYGRPQKPFAVMCRDIDVVRSIADISEDEERMLRSSQRPIVLLKKAAELDVISPGLPNIGIYLPYSGVHHVLFRFLRSDSIIMTSANLPGEPMATRNEDAFSL
ncbi:carbamoyltransferase HypF, partial [Methanosarcinales archaeon]